MSSQYLKAGAALSALLAFTAAPALADQSEVQTTAPVTAEAPEPSQNAMVNLVRLLVAKGVLSAADGDGLMKEALSEAAQAKGATPIATIGAPSAPPPPPGVLRVPYIPELVRNQIKDEVKQEVMAQARDENWAQPNALPEWLKHIEWSGDLRVRDEFDLYAKNNTDEFIDFAAFNASGPTDFLANPSVVPLLNTRTDRLNNLSVRARLGLKAEVADGVIVGLRLATGRDTSPVSTTQVLGGGLGKKDIWLDQAYVTVQPVAWAGATAGRMPNPFFHTDLVYDDDLNFDGAAAAFNSGELIGDNLKAFATLGAFPLEYGASNFPTYSTSKAPDQTKWLFGGQLGMEWSFAQAYRLKLAAAYYDFQGVKGRLSDPCFIYLGDKQCSTDQTRPAFMQKGNTLFLIRDVVFPDPSVSTNLADPQFMGLAYDYNLLDLNSEFDAAFGERHLLFQADYVRNLAYDARDACRRGPAGIPINNVDSTPAGNVDPCSSELGDGKARLASGPNGWLLKASFGDPKPREFGQWNLGMGYRYLEPDAALDSLTDSDFRLGGTNAKGWFVAASFGVFKNAWITTRWLSGDEVFGPPLSIDVGQIDLNIGF